LLLLIERKVHSAMLSFYNKGKVINECPNH
jgi:hypothetical protein